MTTEPDTLCTLPVVVHAASLPRQSAADLARFEAVANATDAAVASSMCARRVAASSTTTLCEGEACEALRALLEAIGAITNAEVVPQHTESKRELVRWTLCTIRDWNNAGARARVNSGRATSPNLDPAQTGACMELVGRLNAALGGGAI
jgi:hypothetical protein